MFTYTGRAVFLIFLGAITFGMLTDSEKGTTGYNWCVGVGVATMANSIFNCFVICSHPGFQKGDVTNDGAEVDTNDPSKLTDAQIKAYLQAHPELAIAAANSMTVSSSADASVQDWGASAAKGSASSTTGGVGSIFGFGKKKETGQPKPNFGSDAEVGYTPPPISPTVQASAGPSASSASYSMNPATTVSAAPKTTKGFYDDEDDDVGYKPTAVPTTAAAQKPAAVSVAKQQDDDNPFASDNPFEGGL